MAESVEIEVIGFSHGSCGPFPCDENRSCGLVACCPTEELVEAVKALEKAVSCEYGGKASVKFTLLDDGIPDDVRAIIEEHQPPLPIVLVNGKLTPIGRVSFSLIKKEIGALLD
ncbi:MAG: hypothetical protein PWP08_1093 [Methanofollis sp.]|nr:hypothetical protein [Methanofollis sp.]